MSDVLTTMGNHLPSSLEDGGVEHDRPSLYSDTGRSYWDDNYSSEDDDPLDVVIDIESGGRAHSSRVDISPEDKALRIYGMLKELHPPDIPICKRMLYFNMIYSEMEIDETDIALGAIVTSSGNAMMPSYWMMSSHIYVDTLKHNESRLEVDPIFENVKADDLHFVCIQKEHVDRCVLLFWEKIVEMGLEVYQGDTPAPISENMDLVDQDGEDEDSSMTRISLQDEP